VAVDDVTGAAAGDLRALVSALPDMRAGVIDAADFLARRYFTGLGNPTAESILASHLAVLFWFDDRVDQSTEGSTPWTTWLGAVDTGDWTGGVRGDPAAAEVLQAFGACEHALWSQAQSRRARDRWRHGLREVVEAMAFEQLLSRGDDCMTFAEYVAVGARSCTIPHLVVTSAWLLGPLAIASLDDPYVSALCRKTAIAARLENDIWSWHKEREEGCAANAVLVLAKPAHDLASAEARVAAELIEVEAAIQDLALRLQDRSPIVSVLRAMPSSHREWYRRARDRYRPQALPCVT
jgi:hypothetical protein